MLPGGSLVITHSNELFDVFTLNRYTKLFFEKHFSLADTACDVSTLLAHPNVPSRRIFGVRENPLSYPEKLRRLGFDQVAQEFAILHPMPPLLTPEINFDDINTRTYPATLGWAKEDKWKLAFMCSIFGSRAVALP